MASEKLYELRDFDAKRRELIIETEDLKKQRNEASEAIGLAKRNKEDASTAIAQMQEVSSQIKALDSELTFFDEKVTGILETLPNIPADDVPIGADEDDNVEVKRVGEVPNFAFWTGNVALKSLDHASYSIKVWAHVLSAHSTTSC